MKRRNSLTIILAILLSISMAFAGHHKKKAANDIVDTAVAAGSFNTLVAAVKAAGLVETLKGDGPFTVFAPTDEAFAQLPEGTVESLLKPENKDQLIAILTYHVVAGKVTASQVVQIDQAKTVNGQSVQVRTDDGNVFVDKSQVVQTDIMTSNGVIHVIDRVLLPAEEDAQEMGAIDLIEDAIERGVPLYNNGQPAACAAVYEMTAKALLNLGDDLPPAAWRSLHDALVQSVQTTSAAKKAWMLRHALDNAYAALQYGSMTRL